MLGSAQDSCLKGVKKFTTRTVFFVKNGKSLLLWLPVISQPCWRRPESCITMQQSRGMFSFYTGGEGSTLVTVYVYTVLYSIVESVRAFTDHLIVTGNSLLEVTAKDFTCALSLVRIKCP